MAAKNITLKSADIVGEPTEERLTAFNSHGARFYRLTVPRDFAATLETDLNRWTVTRFADGSLLAVPMRELIEVPSKAPQKSDA